MIRKALFSFFVLYVILLQPVYGEQTGVFRTEDTVVLFEEPLERAAKEVADIYPGVKVELEEALRWKLNFRPTVLLISDREKFKRMAGSDRIVAFAVPENNLVVIDYSRMNTRPFTLGVTLKHELCHLLLHNYLGNAGLPKWLDEGVCQWVSDGIAEIILDTKRSVLKEATLSEAYIPMDALAQRFPQDEKSLMLAYEQSKSFVEYIDSEFGRDGILNVLANARGGDEVDVAILKAVSISLDELERRWHNHLRKRTTWFTYLSRNLYGILFFLAALITIYAFIRVLIKKRRYEDEEDDSSFS